MHQFITKTAAVGLLGLGFLLAGCSKNDSAADSSQKTTITFGATVGDFSDMVKSSITPILEAKGYKVKLIEFYDYVQPNLALADGDLDINIFQHKPYLDTFTAEHKLALAPVFQVPTGPLGLYSGKLSSLEDLKNGVKISIPNDPSNLARGLIVLKELGWLELKEDISPLRASLRDITNNPHGINLILLEAAQIPRARDDVDFAIINGNYAVSAKIDLTSALYQEPSYDYINWGVVRTADVDAPWVKDVIEAYESEAFKTYAKGHYPGYRYPQSW